MPFEIFVSHSSIDKDAANAVCQTLEANGFSCWIAPRDIVPGIDWSESIIAALEECPAVVLIFSENANASQQVRREVQRSFEKRKYVVPFRIDNVIPTGSMEYYLAPVHWLTSSNPPAESDFIQLIEAMQKGLRGEKTEYSPGDVMTGTNAGMDLQATGTIAASNVSIINEVRGNLPEIASPYIGRVNDLIRWQEELQEPSTRVFTLLGFGGMGKTRSALELAHRVQEKYVDGVWWLELEEATTGIDMVRRIAMELHIDLQPSLKVEDQLMQFLKSRHTLLVLDNTEQIEDAGVYVKKLVQGTEHAQYLITSRRALELPYEHIAEVSPLPKEEAEEFFIDRAKTRSPEFERDENNTADIEEICVRLEGMPLAIELAASRIVSMTPHEILSRLGEWNRLLQTRSPHLPPRQRAIQGAIEWSHDLLNDDDKDLFAQLAVFSNGFTLKAAEAICDAFDVFEGVHELRRHSFLRAQTHAATQQTRFFMLELVREFAEQKLTRNDIKDRHADYFLKFIEERSKCLRTREEPKVLDEIAVELDNLRAALDSSRQDGNLERAIRLSVAIARPAGYLGFWSVARDILNNAWNDLTQLSGDKSVSREGGESQRIRHEMASVTLDLGDHATARQYAAEACHMAQEAGDTDAEAGAENLIGLSWMEEDAGQAAVHFNKALELWRDHPGIGKGIALHNLAMIALSKGDTDHGRTLYEESLEARRSAGDSRGEAETLGNLGALEYIAGNTDRARDLYKESLDIRVALRDRLGIGLMLHNLAEYYEANNDNIKAIGLYTHAMRIFIELQSAYTAGPQEALENIRQAIGEDQYNQLRSQAVTQPWKSLLE